MWVFISTYYFVIAIWVSGEAWQCKVSVSHSIEFINKKKFSLFFKPEAKKANLCATSTEEQVCSLILSCLWSCVCKIFSFLLCNSSSSSKKCERETRKEFQQKLNRWFPQTFLSLSFSIKLIDLGRCSQTLIHTHKTRNFPFLDWSILETGEKTGCISSFFIVRQ